MQTSTCWMILSAPWTPRWDDTSLNSEAFCFFPWRSFLKKNHVSVFKGVSIFFVSRCICGLLKKKPRILVTHQLQYLRAADEIVVLKEVRLYICMYVCLLVLLRPCWHKTPICASCFPLNFTLTDATFTLSGGCQGHVVARGTYNELQGSGLDFTSLLMEKEGQEEEKQDPSTVPVCHGHHDNLASSLSSLSSSQHSLFDGGESQAVVGIFEIKSSKKISHLKSASRGISPINCQNIVMR